MAIKKNFSSAEYFYNNNDLGNAKKVCQSILTENIKNYIKKHKRTKLV